jgi:hypothetical protein
MAKKTRSKPAKRGTSARKRRPAKKSVRRGAAVRRSAPKRKAAPRKKKQTFMEKVVAKAGKAIDALVEAAPPPAALSKTYPL